MSMVNYIATRRLFLSLKCDLVLPGRPHAIVQLVDNRLE